MRAKTLSTIFVVLAITMILPISYLSAYDEGIEDGDTIQYGYKLYIRDNLGEWAIIEEFNRGYPVQKVVSPETIIPSGLYNEIIGMKEGDIKNLYVFPEDGFKEDDPHHSYLAGEELFYENLEIYKVIPKSNTGTESPSWLIAFLAIVGTVGGLALIYLIWRFWPRIVSKRCINCKKPAIGYCDKCKKSYCKHCYSGGCLVCNGKTLKRFGKKN